MDQTTNTDSENANITSLTRLLASLESSLAELETLGLTAAADLVERAIQELSTSPSS